MKDFMTGEPLHTLFVHSVFYLTDLLLRVDGSVAAVLLVLWLLGFIAFHVTFGAIHLLLVIAVVLFVAHFLTGRSAAV